jgi:hypothetical protein
MPPEKHFFGINMELLWIGYAHIPCNIKYMDTEEKRWRSPSKGGIP